MKPSQIKIVLIFSILLTSSLQGQDDLYIPRDIQKTYNSGTRSLDGKPGPNYWQNSADYKIEAEFDPVNYLLNGREEITYYNDSPDSLNRIVMRLYPNIFKKGSARDYSILPEAVNDGVIIKNLSVDGHSINLENKSIFRVMSTVAIIYLPKAVQSNSSANISIEWSFTLPINFTLRIGVYDTSTFFIGYWYPQIAVYDDINGWDYLNYSGQAEFYNDFSNFEVSITAPKNFGVWATGELQNPEEVLTSEILGRYVSAKNSAEVIRIITPDDLHNSIIFNNENEKNKWKYKAENVSDFAFALSNKYLWDGLSFVADSVENKSVFIQTIYPEYSPDFYDVAEACKDIIKYFSEEIPGVKFPFPSIVAFNTGRPGGGMEFPMMINDGSTDIWEHTVSLTSHELAHQYFPFYVGTNEKKYAFMDEGWAVMLPFDYMENLAGINSRLISTVGNYEYNAGTENDLPAMISSFSMPYSSYRNSAYDRSSISYNILRNILGDELFFGALREFMNRWKGKHPIPYDFFFTFNDFTGQNLNWFWKPWFFERGYPDLAIDKVVIKDSAVIVTVTKIGNIPTPVKLKLTYEDDSVEDYYYTAKIWQNNERDFSAKIKLSKTIRQIELGDLQIPDSNRDNNLFLVH